MIRAALTLAVLALVAVPASASAAEVRVIAKDGRELTFDLAAHAGGEDVDARYTIRSSPSEATTDRIEGFSVATVLEGATHAGSGDHFDAFSFTYVGVRRPGGGSVLLSNGQVRPGAYVDGPPVIYADGQRVGFLRPQRDPDDINASDSFSAPGPLVIEEGAGGLVEVKLTASPMRPKVGARVTFTAEVTRQGAGQQLDFRWSFGDGSAPKTGRQVSHAFSRRGCFGVGLGVRERGRSVGGDSVRILVETPENDCDDAPGGAKKRPKPGRGGSGDRSGGGGGGTGDGDGGGAGRSDAGGSSDAGGRDRERDRDRARRPADDLDSVTGELLDDPGGSSADAGTEDEAQEAPPPTPPSELAEQSGVGGSGVAVGLLVTMALLGLGASRELERVRLEDLSLGSVASRARALLPRWWR